MAPKSTSAPTIPDLADPHLSGLSPDPVAAIKALGLRQASWSEVGPDAFFFGVNAVVAVFAALVFYSGALPSAAPAPGAPAAAFLALFARVATVNLAIMVAFYGGYHWVFYDGGYERLYGKRPTKFNPAGYEPGQLTREKTFTTLAMLIATAYHVVAIIGASRGWFLQGALPTTPAEAAKFGALFFAFALASDGHFWFVHRALHIPAIYKVVHKLHHESKNPGPWSGLSMHPIESAVYLSKVLIPLCVAGAHPLHFAFLLWNATLMPVMGHSGHEEMLGNEYHWLHHHTFQGESSPRPISLRDASHLLCAPRPHAGNYGSPAVPLDKLFGCHFQLPKMDKKMEKKAA